MDPKSTPETMAFLQKYTAAGNAVLLSSHHMAEVVERICTRVGIINHGALIADSPLVDLLAAAEKKYSRAQTLEDIFIRLVSGTA